MALRAAFRTSTTQRGVACLLELGRSAHSLCMPAPGNRAVDLQPAHPIVPEDLGFFSEGPITFDFPESSIDGGSMELMAVPKKKVSKYKRGIRNGPKALKPIPVIIRCRNCGKVKLPHFYCCGGRREASSEN